MSTDVDASRRRRSHRWLAALVGLATVAVVGLLKVVDTGGSAGDEPAGRPDQATTPPPAFASHPMTAAVRKAAAARLAEALEEATPAEHHSHGHEGAAAGTVVCAVDPFGADPPGAATIDLVQTVYALHLCAVAEPGRDWDVSVRYSGPLAARLGDPPVITVVQAGAGYPERVHNLIPERYWARATGPFRDEAALADLRHRFDAARR